MKVSSAVLVTSVLAGLVLTPLASRAEVESKDPIKIALFDWTSVNLTPRSSAEF
jgi:ABC-type proline/glycine betaine transport system substrate-binding protein